MHHIDASVGGDGEDASWHFTGFYGNPVESERYISWDLLRTLAIGNGCPWLVIGDFNEILFSHEKLGEG